MKFEFLHQPLGVEGEGEPETPAVRAADKLPMFLVPIPFVFLYGELPAKDFFDIVFVAPVRIDENAAYSRALARKNELEIIIIGMDDFKAFKAQLRVNVEATPPFCNRSFDAARPPAAHDFRHVGPQGKRHQIRNFFIIIGRVDMGAHLL